MQRITKMFSTAALLSLVASGAHAVDVNWVGGTSSDVTVGSNWDTASVPAPGTDVARFSGATNPDLNGNSVTWGSMWLGSGDSTIAATGGGTINLNATLNGNGSSFWAVGNSTSTIAANLDAVGRVVSNNEQNVSFNGSVTTTKIESYNTSVMSFNGGLTMTDGFIGGHSTASHVLNSTTNWNFGGEKGLNSGGTVVLGAGFAPSANWGVWNLFNGSTVRLGGDNVLGGDIDLWTRTASNTLDLDGYSTSLEFLGSNAGTVLNIDFGDTPGANTLIWAASHNSDGTYNITNFEQGVDSLILGAAGAGGGFDPDNGGTTNLNKLTINGLGYEEDLGNGVYWTVIDADGTNHQVQFVPEPTSLALLGFGGLLVARRRRG